MISSTVAFILNIPIPFKTAPPSGDQVGAYEPVMGGHFIFNVIAHYIPQTRESIRAEIILAR